MDMFAAKSSMIASYGWDRGEGGKGLLVIEFVNGERWNYVGVPESVLASFLMAPSKGGYFRRFIRPLYEGVKDQG